MRPTLKKSEVHELLHNTLQQLKESYSVEFEELKNTPPLEGGWD